MSRYELSQRTIKAIKALAIAAISLIVKTNSHERAGVQDLRPSPSSPTRVMEKEINFKKILIPLPWGGESERKWGEH